MAEASRATDCKQSNRLSDAVLFTIVGLLETSLHGETLFRLGIFSFK
jgi:hypothetical protein